MARMARMNSRIRAAGDDHGMEKRFVMWARICDPRPSTKRPLEAAFKSWPTCASTIGVRANATAMPVTRSTRSVSCAAKASGMNGSWAVSAVWMPL